MPSKRRYNALLTEPHGSCVPERPCAEHAQDPRVPSCKKRDRGLGAIPGGIRQTRGKFDTAIDEYIYRLTLDGFGDQTGDVEGPGYYSSIDLGFEILQRLRKEAIENGDRLTTEEETLIEDSVGAIVYENSQGFVYVTYYDDENEFAERCGRRSRRSATNGAKTRTVTMNTMNTAMTMKTRTVIDEGTFQR